MFVAYTLLNENKIIISLWMLLILLWIYCTIFINSKLYVWNYSKVKKVKIIYVSKN